MSDHTSIAVATPPDLEDQQASQKRSRQADARPKRQPPYAVVLLNDEEHSFLYVIETLMKVFGYPAEKCQALTVRIHNEGQGIVWSGSLEVAELKRDQIRSAGPDFHAVNKVEFPLGVTIEPLPG